MTTKNNMRVAVSGIGLYTPLGTSVMETWRNLIQGANGIGPIRRFDPTGFPVRFAAECTDPVDVLESPVTEWILGLRSEAAAPKRIKLQGGHGLSFSTAHLRDRVLEANARRGQEQIERIRALLSSLKGRLTLKAAEEALMMAAVPGEVFQRWNRESRFGICLGSEAARPGLADVAQQRLAGEFSGTDLTLLAPQAPAELLKLITGASGPVSIVSTACTSSSQAIGEGLARIRRGEVDAMLVGGVDVLVDPIMVTGFSLLGALSSRNDDPSAASRPFDLGRDGFVLGEGAGMLLLESERSLRERGGSALAELSGFGCSCNAYRITDSPPDGRGAAQSMTRALQDAGLTAAEVGYINAHGTSTKMNDASETRGIYTAFGEHAKNVYVSSTKSMMGHLVAACGAVEAIIALLAVREERLPPTRNLTEVDPECELRHIRDKAVFAPINHAMSNAFGFGGSNGTVIVSRWSRR